ncbi:thermonuclease family protein [Thauera phenylacetica]|uniref:thermonuclease family protein n=1 Tax=Thauera phenylacetica TaxID=164400 RepID=UPI0039E4036B
MDRVNRLTARIALLAAALLLPTSATLALEGRGVAVADGDTFTILDSTKRQHRVRLSEIDAPEKGQPFGSRAKQALSDLCFGRVAEIRDTSADRYGRVVGAVYSDGRSANAELVRQGMAWVYVQHARRGSELFIMERDARDANRGVWSDPKPVPPWEWRRGTREIAAASRVPASSATGEIRGNRRSGIYHLPHCPSYEAVSYATLAYGDEGRGGCTADDDFFDLLATDFELDEATSIAVNAGHWRFFGMHDRWWVGVKR